MESSSSEKPYGLNSELINIIKNTILNNVKTKKVILFGSRATGKYSVTSDIDLAVDTDDDISVIRGLLREEIPTLLKFDLVDLKNANDKLRKEIFEEGIVLYETV
ncbi:nucleotidyltransferase domain-containing protein [Candidatus Margulisiibacteriota bacterium]